mmetsp:Transcript_5883/g.18447  ORF Transcript_5883/g.18447 Transcript_5883/m.18447 type:complete len:86 (-) Transcript_5883:1394-1651(-)|eukprot:scaffold228461_cov35-Tisochrysis_lutea.AAC.2
MNPADEDSSRRVSGASLPQSCWSCEFEPACMQSQFYCTLGRRTSHGKPLLGKKQPVEAAPQMQNYGGRACRELFRESAHALSPRK